MKTYYVWIGTFEESDFEQYWDNEFYENNIVKIPEHQHEYKKDYYKGIPLISIDRVYGEIVKRLEES